VRSTHCVGVVSPGSEGRWRMGFRAGSMQDAGSGSLPGYLGAGLFVFALPLLCICIEGAGDRSALMRLEAVVVVG
jgi:hypothetical protein